MKEIDDETEWLEPWVPSDRHSEALEKELLREISPGHKLQGVSLRAVGRRTDSDDVLFELKNFDYQCAVVHLTWRKETSADWPFTVLFETFEQWRIECMVPDNHQHET